MDCIVAITLTMMSKHLVVVNLTYNLVGSRSNHPILSPLSHSSKL